MSFARKRSVLALRELPMIGTYMATQMASDVKRLNTPGRTGLIGPA